eukprot:3277338-Amphidinium_carterae.2
MSVPDVKVQVQSAKHTKSGEVWDSGGRYCALKVSTLLKDLFFETDSADALQCRTFNLNDCSNSKLQELSIEHFSPCCLEYIENKISDRKGKGVGNDAYSSRCTGTEGFSLTLPVEVLHLNKRFPEEC